MTAILPRPRVIDQVERAVSLTGHPTRPLTDAERAEAIAILQAQGCVPTEIRMRLGENP